MRKLSFAVCLCLFWLVASASAATLFNFGTNWSYFIGTTEASTPPSAWRSNNFNDSGWLSGPTPIGYAAPANDPGGYEAAIRTTLPTSTAGNYTTVYLRRTFVVSDPTNFTQFRFNVVCDDGFVLWVNGSFVTNYNVPGIDLAFNAVASSSPEAVLTAFTVNYPSNILVAGTNVVAIHLLNGAIGSSDLVLDASLEGVEADPVPPAVASKFPVPGTVTNLSQVSVTFSESVTGVQASDLLVNGQPAASATGSNNTYTFSFVPPAYGTVSINWDGSHGIQDLAFPPNPFNALGAGATWQYNLIDNVPPTIASRIPAPGFTIRGLTGIQVQFSEAVTNVDAADLIVSGNAATNVTFTPPSTFTFQFPPPPTGTVVVVWDPGHGIRDLAAPPNNFTAVNWTYTLDPNAAEADVVITEFMAENTSTLADEDGDYPDWIEIHNTGDLAVNLAGWHLTDKNNDLTKWTFPTTNINGHAFMVIFASEKDRRIAGRPLHTNFKLDKEGEYLALVKPNGAIASKFSPTFPAQAPNVSYGLPTLSTPTAITAPGGSARVYVPTNTSLGLDWVAPAFDDSNWLQATNGVGFENNPAPPSLTGSFNSDLDALMRTRSPSAYIRIPFVVSDPSMIDVLTLRMKYNDGFAAYVNGTEVARRNLPKTVANSVSDFSDTQGSNNWYYGYYNKTADGDATYQAADFIAFPREAGAFSAANYWTGSIWNWFAGDPPWTEISNTGGHPNGSNAGAEHWAIRRWISEVSGNLTVHFRLAKSNTGGGNGVTGRIFHNGVQLFSRTIAFNDAGTLTNEVSILSVVAGDFIDIALDSTGTDGLATDASDGSIFTAVIDQEPGLPLGWDTVAASARTDTQSTAFEDMDITPALAGMQAGTNWLAIHGVNAGAANGDFLIAAQIESQARALQFDQVRYFTTPTPGADNGIGIGVLGPIISETGHSPNVPRTNQNITVTARITATVSPVASVTLWYRIMFMATNGVPMLDDGLHGDGVAGDGIYGAFIPPALSTNGQMRRWYITATDTSARTTRFPTFATTNNTPEYLGTLVYPEQINNLPMLHMFLVNPLAANTAAGTKCSLFWEGEFYDNLAINIHGQSSSGWAIDKKSYDIDFHPEHKFRWKDGEPRVDDINLLGTYADKTKVRNVLAYETYALAGGSHHFVVPVRVQQNGAFFAIYDLVENGDNNYLKRLGKDPNGALYKVYNAFTAIANTTIGGDPNSEKKTRRQEGNADLVALFNGLANTATPMQSRINYFWDNINIPATIDFLAARVITGDIDCCHKNYYFYRDTGGTGEWEGMPWDVDLSYGHNWNSTEVYFDNALIPGNGLGVGGNNGVFGFLINSYAPAREMYIRRVRTLMDEILQAPGTPATNRIYEKRADEMFAMINADNDLDLAKWGTWRDVSTGQGPTSGAPTFDTNHVDYETLAEAHARLKQYLIDRRISMFARSPGEVPIAQPTNATIIFGTVEFNPGSGIQAEEYIQLRNTNNYAVDISGWKMGGGIHYTFLGGCVIPAGGTLHLSPDVKAFRARGASPRGNEGRFVQGNYQGQLSARGESLALSDNTGRVVVTNAYPGAPSLAQQYLRITEIMYHPPASPPGAVMDPEEFEFIELKNIGPAVLNLTGVHFTNGVEFAFTSANVTNLPAGATIVLAKNPAAFASRYPSVANVTGPYIGSLDNRGETIRLDDAVGEKILDFSYNNSWYPMTDGPGLSLVIVDENALWSTWDLKESWRPSSEFGGSPGGAAAPALTLAPILVNEVSSHTALPELDTIELYNPTTNDVDVGNWLISDDFGNPRKFRIPAPHIIPAGGYDLFTEVDFNSGAPGSFAFSSVIDEVYLFSGDASGNPNGYYHGFGFDGATIGVAFGRHINSAGDEHFVAQSITNTFGGPNARPRVGPVIISEIMYHPPDVPAGTNLLDDTENEFVELQNLTTNAVPLYDPAFPTNKWKLTDGISYVFSTNDVLSPTGLLVVVSFNPGTNATALANFRARYNVAANVPIVGPYSGKLDNSEDKVELYRPGAPTPAGEVPFILVERVHYRDLAPWDIIADGFGASLQRFVPGDYGNEPTNWIAASPSPGAARASDGAAVITLQPVDTTVFVAGSAGTSTAYAFGATNFTGAVNGSGVTYQWRFNGNAIPGATSATLTLSNIQYSMAGTYSFLAFNGSGSAISSNATLTVTAPVQFTVQPTNQNVLPGTNVTLACLGVGTGTVRYQWRFEGTNILNATNSSHSFANANLFEHHGNFSCVVMDDISANLSANAFIYVLVKPFVTSHITSQTVLQGQNATFSLVATGAPPLWYRWIRNGGSILGATTSVPVLTITNVQASGTIRCAVTNTALPASGTGAFSPGPAAGQNVQLIMLADADGDGMWDIWETNYFGGSVGTNFALVQAGADADADGMSNRDEFLAGTNPTNALSLLNIVLTATNASVLQFVAQTNLTYSVQCRTNFSTALWNNITNLTSSTLVRTITVHTAIGPAADERYYRVVTPRVP